MYGTGGFGTAYSGFLGDGHAGGGDGGLEESLGGGEG